MSEALGLSVEALSWMELERLSERQAFAKASKQLAVKNVSSLRMAQLMIMETLRRLNLIDEVADEALHPKSLGSFKLGVKNFIRLYIYWTKFHRSSFNEAVNFLKSGRRLLGWRELRPVEIAFGKILGTDPNDLVSRAANSERIALETFHPAWFVQLCSTLLGRGEAVKLLRGNMKPPPTYLRVNTLRGDEEDILNELSKEGIELEEVVGLRFLYKLVKAKVPLVRTDAYKSGLFHIQDKSSCLCVDIADAKPRNLVLDICAAPGSKTSYLAQLMKNRGRIHSVDYSTRRMGVWKKEMNRLGVKIAEPLIGDARQPLPLNMKADIAVLDPPCTGTGIFARTPLAKWRTSPDTIHVLSKVQWSMLENLCELIKPGGSIIYSTCSITLEENEFLIERFLKLHPDFKLAKARKSIGLPGFRGLVSCQRLYPHIHESNGFFVAKLVRSY